MNINSGKSKPSKEEIQVSILHNAIYYFLMEVLIIHENGYYRLIVISSDRRILMDKRYKNARAARIAFSKKFKPRLLPDETKGDWGPFFEPEKIWVNEKGLQEKNDGYRG